MLFTLSMLGPTCAMPMTKRVPATIMLRICRHGSQERSLSCMHAAQAGEVLALAVS
jgi:hypothetical protein